MIYILTHTGIKFDLQNPTADMICLEDIAHALSNICRFTGHSKHFYSVAEHSIKCASVAMRLGRDKYLQRAVFLHDAHEAYIGDVSRPLKLFLRDYREIEEKLQLLVSARFDLICKPNDPDITYIDGCMLEVEMQELMGHKQFNVTEPFQNAFDDYILHPKSAFLRMARELGLT